MEWFVDLHLPHQIFHPYQIAQPHRLAKHNNEQ